jgi:hypothetical protein
MGPLSDIFGGNDSDNSSSTSDANGMLDGALNNTLGLDLNSSSESYDQDEDGNTSYDSSDNSLSLDNDTDGLLNSVGDIFSSSDESDSN